MEEKRFSVPNITCGHCVMAIQNELGLLPGVKSVEGDPAQKHVTVKWEAPASLKQILQTLKEINYPASN